MEKSWLTGQVKYNKRRSFPERNRDNDIFGCECPEKKETPPKNQNQEKSEHEVDIFGRPCPDKRHSYPITRRRIRHDFEPQTSTVTTDDQSNEPESTDDKTQPECVSTEYQEVQQVDKDTEEDLSQESKTSEIKMRQWLVDNSPEIRDLQRKLQAAYVAKEQATQLAEKEHDRIQELKKLDEEKATTSAALETHQAEKRREKLATTKKKEHLRKGLQKQLVQKQKIKEEKFEEFLKEKEIIDEIVQRMHDEDTKITEEKMHKRLQNKADIDAFLEARKVWRARHEEEVKQENERLKNFVNTYDNIIKKHESEKKVATKKREKTAERLGVQLQDEWLGRQHVDHLRQELLELEKKQKEEERLIREKRQSFEYKVNLRKTLQDQMEDKRVRSQQEIEDDHLYRQQMTQKLAEERQIDRLTADKRRIKLIEIRKEITDEINERRSRQVEQVRMAVNVREQDRLQEASRTRIIEDERKRLLTEHAKNLIGFLPPGLLREDEREYLNPEQ